MNSTESMRQNDTALLRRIGEVTTNLTIAVLFALFAYAHLNAFLSSLRPSLLGFTLKETLDAFFFLTRRKATMTSESLYAWVAGILGTLLPLFLRPVESASEPLIGQLILWTGIAMQIAAVSTLGRSLGIVPAHRGLKTSGMYRWIRHPLYTSYLVTQTGYVIGNPSLYNIEILVAATLCQVLRILNEERFLTRDPSYVEYTAKTHWRLIPLVF